MLRGGDLALATGCCRLIIIIIAGKGRRRGFQARLSFCNIEEKKKEERKRVGGQGVIDRKKKEGRMREEVN